MKVPVYGLKGESKGEVTVGSAFSRKVRPDVIKKAVLSEKSKERQPYGSDPLAGQRTSAKYKGRRGRRGSMMNREIARMKRITGGGNLRFRARSVPQAVKGRKAHPPKAEKNWAKEMNKKEKMLALISAVSATADRDLVLKRGHKIEGVKHIPLVLDDNLEGVKKTADVKNVLESLGLGNEIERCARTKTRAGRGKTRGRRTVKRKGLLVIVNKDNGISRAAKNIPGLDISSAKDLNVGMLAPGTVPGRLSLWTKSAIEHIDKISEGR